MKIGHKVIIKNSETDDKYLPGKIIKIEEKPHLVFYAGSPNKTIEYENYYTVDCSGIIYNDVKECQIYSVSNLCRNANDMLDRLNKIYEWNDMSFWKKMLTGFKIY